MKWEMQLISQDSNYIFIMLRKLVIIQCIGYIEGKFCFKGNLYYIIMSLINVLVEWCLQLVSFFLMNVKENIN